MRLRALAVAGALALTGCGATAETARPRDSSPIRDGTVPATLLALRSQPEDIGKALEKAGDKAFVDAVRLWSLREGTLLRATLEVARFMPDAPTDDDKFRANVSSQVGGTTPQQRRVGADEVYVSAGNRQVYYVWFRGRAMVLLAVPASSTRSRSLLRVALREVRP